MTAGDRTHDELNVLVVTNLYPSESSPARGPFIRSQVESLHLVGVRTELSVIDGFADRQAYARAIVRLRRRISDGPAIDLIHAHYGYSGWVTLAAQLLCTRVPAPPIVVSFLGSDLESHGETGITALIRRMEAAINRALVPSFAGIIVKSEAMRRSLQGSARESDGRVYVIPNGLDLERFRPISGGSSPLQKTAECIDVLFAADPNRPEKRFRLAQAAVDRATALLQTEPVAASGPRRCRLHTIHGRPQEEMPAWMNAADVLILSSAHEGSPNVVKEAMACNLPIVATAVGDVPALLHEVAGTTVVFEERFEARAVDALARGILRGHAHGRTRGRERMAGLSLEAIARRIRAVYDEALR